VLIIATTIRLRPKLKAINNITTKKKITAKKSKLKSPLNWLVTVLTSELSQVKILVISALTPAIIQQNLFNLYFHVQIPVLVIAKKSMTTARYP